MRNLIASRPGGSKLAPGVCLLAERAEPFVPVPLPCEHSASDPSHGYGIWQAERQNSLPSTDKDLTAHNVDIKMVCSSGGRV